MKFLIAYYDIFPDPIHDTYKERSMELYKKIVQIDDLELGSLYNKLESTIEAAIKANWSRLVLSMDEISISHFERIFPIKNTLDCLYIAERLFKQDFMQKINDLAEKVAGKIGLSAFFFTSVVADDNPYDYCLVLSWKKIYVLQLSYSIHIMDAIKQEIAKHHGLINQRENIKICLLEDAPSLREDFTALCHICKKRNIDFKGALATIANNVAEFYGISAAFKLTWLASCDPYDYEYSLILSRD
jgi:hypothetical protein